MTINETSPTYNLGAITRETGLNADTLRAWERRYNLPQPARSSGGQRLYSPRDLETLKWLISRQNEGLRIGQAAKLWHSQVAEGLDPLESFDNTDIHQPIAVVTGSNIDNFKSQWISACKSFDENKAEQIISEAFSQYPPETVCFEVLFAGLAEIGEAWYRGETTVQQEHFASALVTRRLNALIAGAPLPSRSERILIATPPNEDHILSPLLITYLLRRRGWDVIYLGSDVPLENFRQTIKSSQPDLVILTAQQLYTAASLLDLANDLAKLEIPMAFGGLIFNNIPELRHRIPGHFLGEELNKVIFPIEQLLKKSPIRSDQEAVIKLPDYEHFQAALPKIESYVYDQIATIPELRGAPIRYFTRDIIAALKLGNSDFLNSDMEWVSGLLFNLQIPTDALLRFLQIFLQAVEQYLGSNSETLSTWLKTQILLIGDKNKVV